MCMRTAETSSRNVYFSKTSQVHIGVTETSWCKQFAPRSLYHIYAHVTAMIFPPTPNIIPRKDLFSGVD